MAAPAKSTPKDALTVSAILEDMGVAEFDPRLVNAMLEFTYKLTVDTLDAAAVYSTHAGKRNIDVDDIKIAVQTELDHTLTNPPPRDLLLDVAKHKNSIPLPLIKPIGAPILPPDRYCLMSSNFMLSKRSAKRPTFQQTIKPAKVNGPTGVTTLVSGNKMSNMFSSSVIRCKPPTVNMPVTTMSSMSGAAQSSADSLMRKRPREDDDFDS